MTVPSIELNDRLLNVSELWEISDVTMWDVGREGYIFLYIEWSDKENSRGIPKCLFGECGIQREDKLLTDNKAISFSLPYWSQLSHEEEGRGSKDQCLSYTGGLILRAGEDTFCFVFRFISQFVPDAITRVGFIFSQHGLPTESCCW